MTTDYTVRFNQWTTPGGFVDTDRDRVCAVAASNRWDARDAAEKSVGSHSYGRVTVRAADGTDPETHMYEWDNLENRWRYVGVE